VNLQKRSKGQGLKVSCVLHENSVKNKREKHLFQRKYGAGRMGEVK